MWQRLVERLKANETVQFRPKGGSMSGRIASLPTREQINLPVQEQLIVELYSK